MFVSENLDTELGLTYVGDEEEIYREVLQIYVDTAPEKLALIKQLLQEEDWRNYIIEVHALKSTSLNIGASVLSARAKELEFAGKEENYQLIYDNTDEVLELYSEVVEECKRYLGQMEEDSADVAYEKRPEASLEQLRELGERILEECDAFDGDAVENLCDELCGLSYDQVDLEEIFWQVKADVREFEFNRAARRTKEFLDRL